MPEAFARNVNVCCADTIPGRGGDAEGAGMGDYHRRAFLEGLSGGAGILLLDSRFAHAAAGAAGSVNLSLTALTGGLLQISISPVMNAIKPDELGVCGESRSPRR